MLSHLLKVTFGLYVLTSEHSQKLASLVQARRHQTGHFTVPFVLRGYLHKLWFSTTENGFLNDFLTLICDKSSVYQECTCCTIYLRTWRFYTLLAFSGKTTIALWAMPFQQTCGQARHLYGIFRYICMQGVYSTEKSWWGPGGVHCRLYPVCFSMMLWSILKESHAWCPDQDI